MDDARSAAYPPEWNVAFEPAVPLSIAPPPPFDATDDGFYRQPYWAERYTGFDPGTKEYPAGFVTHEGGPALKVALRKDQDTPIELCDGTVIYADIFRAADTPADARLPVILAWSPYGKTTPRNPLSYQRYFTPVSPRLVSGFAQVEGPDPAYWTQHGYVQVNVDQRGVNKSGGDAYWWGMVNAYDAHDVINWIADQPWSNGKVGLSGVSWYGVQQWWTASYDPPEALAAIAPRAHWHDVLRQWLRIGGILNTALAGSISEAIMGEHNQERMELMAAEHPLSNAYWEDKNAKVENIRIPVYQVAGPAIYSSAAFPLLPDGKKWLRLAPSYHLDDYYTPEALETERRFFDRYLKGTDNGWERDTPVVRIEVMEPGADRAGGATGPAKVRTARSWPVENTVYKKLYLDASTGTMVDAIPAAEALSRYDGKTGKAGFTYTFTEDTEITGFLKVKLWVESEDSRDMDLFAKAVKAGSPAAVPVGLGQQRVSVRELDKCSTDWLPMPSLRTNEFLEPGEVVPVEISLRATFLIFRAGEQLLLEIGGDPNIAPSLGPLPPTATDSSNEGNHVIRSGGGRDSFLQIPTLPMG